MKQFTNNYIFIFSTIMVVVVAVLLALAATLLQPKQVKNLEIEKKKSMLESIGIPAEWDEAEALYEKHITGSFILNSKGEETDAADPFNVVLRAEQKKPLEEQSLPVFTANPGDGSQLLIIPVEGKGLWGPVYGFVSIAPDMNTIFGVTFDHKSETPGLGAEINTTPFEEMFKGKKLFEGDKFVSVGILKGGAESDDPHGVDAISGGTITSKGLEKTLYDCLLKYNNYLLKNRK